MKLLLDTHLFIWRNSLPQKIEPHINAALISSSNQLFVSAVSAWEISIKRETGKLAFSGSVETAIQANGFASLPITVAHAEHAGALPKHHADPFDRLLIAQADLEGMVFVTVDRQIGAYGIATLGLN